MSGVFKISKDTIMTIPTALLVGFFWVALVFIGEGLQHYVEYRMGMFENPDQFDITRNPRDQIAFGSGIHTCIGRHLATLEATVYFEQLLQRFPAFRVGERRYKGSGWSRSFAAAEFTCE